MNNAYIVTLMYFSSIEVLVSDRTKNKKCTLTLKPLPCKWLTQYLPWWQCIVVCVCFCVYVLCYKHSRWKILWFCHSLGRYFLAAFCTTPVEKSENQRGNWYDKDSLWLKWVKSVLFQWTRICTQITVKKKSIFHKLLKNYWEKTHCRGQYKTSDHYKTKQKSF